MHERKATLFALLIKNEGWRKTKKKERSANYVHNVTQNPIIETNQKLRRNEQ